MADHHRMVADEFGLQSRHGAFLQAFFATGMLGSNRITPILPPTAPRADWEFANGLSTANFHHQGVGVQYASTRWPFVACPMLDRAGRSIYGCCPDDANWVM